MRRGVVSVRASAPVGSNASRARSGNGTTIVVPKRGEFFNHHIGATLALPFTVCLYERRQATIFWHYFRAGVRLGCTAMHFAARRLGAARPVNPPRRRRGHLPPPCSQRCKQNSRCCTGPGPARRRTYPDRGRAVPLPPLGRRARTRVILMPKIGPPPRRRMAPHITAPRRPSSCISTPLFMQA